MGLGPFPWCLTQFPGQDNPIEACSLRVATTPNAHLPQGLQLGFLLVFPDLELVLVFLDLELVPAFPDLELVPGFLDLELVLVFQALGQVQVRDLLG